MNIPFNKPFIVGKELYYIAKAVLNGHIAGDGHYSKLCSEWMKKQFKAKEVLLTHSCTAALEVSALLLDIQPGDEVILPSFTFVSTANAFILRGAKPIFVDIRQDTLNIDEHKIEEKISTKTKAIIPVHYAGVSCEMDTICEIANKHNIPVVEDAAQGVNSTYKGKYLGTIGNLGCYSFHETKNFISGEGGALVINDDSYLERAEIIREKGTNRKKFIRGEVDKYSWVDIGSSYLPSDIIAAFLYAQLEESEAITKKRHSIVNYYSENLKELHDNGKIKIPMYPPECIHNSHMFYILLPNETLRNSMITYLKENNIHSVFHYVPLHTSPMGTKFGYKISDLPTTETISQRLIRLPCYFELTRKEQDHIIKHIHSFCSKM